MIELITTQHNLEDGCTEGTKTEALTIKEAASRVHGLKITHREPGYVAVESYSGRVEIECIDRSDDDSVIEQLLIRRAL